MERAYSVDNVGLRDIKNDPSGELEEHLKQCNGPDARAGFLAEWFDLPNEPKVGDVLWYCTLGPSKNPEVRGLHTIRCFK